MGFFRSFFGGAAAEPISAIGDVIDRTFTSDEERLDAHNTFAKMQNDLQKVFAIHRSPFVAGARPYILYVCGTSLAVYFIPQAIAINAMWITACIQAGELLPFPAGNFDGLWELTIGALGLGGFRTIEKLAGRAK